MRPCALLACLKPKDSSSLTSPRPASEQDDDAEVTQDELVDTRDAHSRSPHTSGPESGAAPQAAPEEGRSHPAHAPHRPQQRQQPPEKTDVDQAQAPPASGLASGTHQPPKPASEHPRPPVQMKARRPARGPGHATIHRLCAWH